MAGLIRAFRRTILSPQSRALAQLSQLQHYEASTFDFSARIQSPQIRCRNYVSELRRKAFDENILRLLRNEIQYEIDGSPPQQLATEVNGFVVDGRPGEQWVSLEKKFGNDEEIKVEVTMFDGSMPVSKPEDGKSGQIGEEEMLHITLIVSIFKSEYDKVLEFICSSWPDAVEIDKIYIRPRGQKPDDPYMGPQFKEIDDQLQNSFYEYLEVRGIDDALCGLLHKYMESKDKSEYLRWMNATKSFIQQKAA